ncbi:MAG: hypothetical protein HY930_05800 [Euryarchaeota archaeon]|nr:hypothetical protein [Euryarchaeota archaeon]
MYEFVDKIREIRSAILRLRVFETLLDAVALFLFLSLIFLLLRVKVAYALIPSFVYILLSAVKSRDALQMVEDRYPNFRERLRAAYDNRGKDNIIIRDLGDKISREMDSVRCSSFLETRKAAGKIFLSIFLALIILYISFEFDALLIEKPIRKPISTSEKVRAGVSKVGVGEAPEAGVFGEGARDIFGAPSIAKIEGEKLRLELYPGAGEIKLRDIKERKFSESPLLAAGASPAEAFSENVPQEYEEVVRVYFEKLTEESK